MSPRVLILFSAFAFLLPCEADCQALRSESKVLVQVGGLSIVIPIPKGFVDSSTSANLSAIGYALTPQRRRLLAFLVSTEDLRATNAGKEPELNQTFAVQTAPVDEDKTFSVETFKRVKQQVRVQMEKMAQSAPDSSTTRLAELLREQAKQTGEPAQLEIDGIVYLGIVEESEYSITGAFVTTAQIQMASSVVKGTNISAITVAAIRGKPVWLITRRALQKEEDIRTNNEYANAWVSLIRAENQ